MVEGSIELEPRPLIIELPHTSERQKIDDLMSPDFEYPREHYSKKFLKEFVKLKGAEVLDKRRSPNDYRCAQYVFATEKGEAWCEPDKNDFGLDFWDHTTEYLKGKGYKRVMNNDAVRDGDVVAYRYKQTTEEETTVLLF